MYCKQLFLSFIGMTCLHLAAEKNDVKVVHHLITLCNADINAQVGGRIFTNTNIIIINEVEKEKSFRIIRNYFSCLKSI